jgi:lipoate-protein ligase A
MALDEALLLSLTTGPWMRVYQWVEPSVSIGFSQPLSVIPPEHASWPVVRRWTGGGVVVHDGDWTYTLGAPAGSPLSEQRAVETYREIHEAMILALADAGLPGGVLQPENTSDGMGVCFVEPAKYDVVWQGQKVAGAAQRRSKAGFLHQGTIQPLKIPPGFGLLFAQRLATQVQVLGQPEANALLLPVALELVESKYGYPEWNTHRSTRPLSV